MATFNASTQAKTEPGGLQAALRRRPLLWFFFLAYAGSWIISIPIVLAEWGYLPKALFTLLFAIKPFVGPFLAAYIMSWAVDGKEGWKRIWRRMFQGRAGLQWYLLILLGIPALYVLSLFVLPGVTGSFQGFPNGSLRYFAVFYLINFVIIFFLGGPLGEEPGWRGFALPRMQARYGGLKGALYLGVVWTFWHLPDFLTSAQGGGPGAGWRTPLINLPIFLVMVVAISVVMAWVFNNTRGSLFMMILLHAAINTTGVIPPLFAPTNMSQMTLGNLGMLITMVALAVVVMVLTRGRLGYSALTTS